MQPQTRLALVLLAVLLAKHMIFDFVLQSRYQLANKHIYGHPGGLQHASLHALGTVVAILIARPTLAVALLVIVVEFAIHYHVDWAKERLLRRRGWKIDDARRWVAFGADQLLHNLSYLAITAVLVSR